MIFLAQTGPLHAVTTRGGGRPKKAGCFYANALVSGLSIVQLSVTGAFRAGRGYSMHSSSPGSLLMDKLGKLEMFHLFRVRDSNSNVWLASDTFQILKPINFVCT